MNRIYKLVSAAVLVLPAVVFAAQPYVEQTNNPIDAVGASVSVVDNDAGSGSDFDASVRVNVFAEKQLSDHLSLQVGLSQSSDSEHTDEDNTGAYELSISHSDVYGGVKVTFNPHEPVQAFARGGLLYYYSQIELRESFYGLKEPGKDEEVEEGTGFYMSAGVAFEVSNLLNLELEVLHLQRSEYFDDSAKPFDFKETGVSVGAHYKFP